MENITKIEARISAQLLVIFLKKNLKHSNLEREEGSKGYRFISNFFNNFKNGEKEIVVLATQLNDKLDEHFGPTTKSEMAAVADIFDYDVTFVPIDRENISKIKVKGSRKYYTKAIFTKR